jgi:hypothetical protein
MGLSGSERRKEEEAIAVFLEFVKLCPYGIDRSSVRHGDNAKGEPDIFCSAKGAEGLAFELTRACDEGVIRSFSDNSALPDACYKAVEELPQAERAKLQQACGDARVVLEWNDSVRLYRGKQSIPAILEFLSALSPADTGRIVVPKNLRKVLQEITIIRCGLRGGPIFDACGAGQYADFTLERVRAKFCKHYSSTCPVDLLVYFPLGLPLQSEERWLPETSDFITNSIACSPFRRVWIWVQGESRVRYAYPGLELPG